MEEEVGNLEDLVAPDSYDGDESEENCYFNSKSASTSVFRPLIRRNNNNSTKDTANTHYSSVPKGTSACNEYDEINIEEKEVSLSLSSGGRRALSPPFHRADSLKENEAAANYKFYMVWFEAFLAKHGLDLDCLDQSSLQQLEKSWVEKQLVASDLRSKEAEIDVNFIKLRYAICKQWLSSL